MNPIDLSWFARHIRAWVDSHARDYRPNMDSEVARGYVVYKRQGVKG
ncbi:MAG: hypothetical protein Q8P59_15090 [Dehalococcoidia bacterium]|nr:hypothetical protein [Dehalococcoidia bacterium]